MAVEDTRQADPSENKFSVQRFLFLGIENCRHLNLETVILLCLMLEQGVHLVYKTEGANKSKRPHYLLHTQKLIIGLVYKHKRHFHVVDRVLTLLVDPNLLFVAMLCYLK